MSAQNHRDLYKSNRHAPVLWFLCNDGIKTKAQRHRRRLLMRYDAIVIGSGQGGWPLSLRLASLGWQVALIEKGPLGGTCINTGCTPTKTMVHRAQIAYYARNAARWGVRAENVVADLPAIVAQKNKVVMGFRGPKDTKVDKTPNLRLYRGCARFTGPHAIQVGDAQLEAEKIFIDTGGRASFPKIPGLNCRRFRIIC